MSSSPTYLDPVIIPLITGESVLDAGCGDGRWGYLIQTNFWEAGLTKPPQVDGFDAFLPNVEFCSKAGCYRKVWQQIMPSPLKGEWDIVLACELIEHIEQESLTQGLDILEADAKKRIIISTPNQPCYRQGLPTRVGYNEFESHLSYTSKSFLEQRGYKLIGAGLWYPKSRLRSIIRNIFPGSGGSLVAYKDI